MSAVPNSSAASPGDDVEEQGRLLREDGGFVLHCDHGGRLRLLLPRTPVDEVEKRVSLTGTLIEADLLEVTSIALA